MFNSNKAVYIPSVDAKDLYLYNYQNRKFPKQAVTGYPLQQQDGGYNLKKFINSFDYSLDLIKLRELYFKIFRKKDFTFTDNNKEYSPHVINVTFKYSIKEYNAFGNIYIKFGYKKEAIKLDDCACVAGHELIAIKVDEPVSSPLPAELLGKHFFYEDGVYRAKNNLKMLHSCSELRDRLYQDGFYCDGIRYVRMKRSSGSARVGKCLFINERLYARMHKWELCGLKIKEGQEVDLAALESYIALSSSSIIDTLELQPENILVIEDYESVFKDTVIGTTAENGWLVSRRQKAEIRNSIWDGQSLIEESAMGKYKGFGMVLLRNRFFKSCCFNTNLQKWFSDNGIQDVKDLNGFTLAQSISDIKLITTPSSIKYLKFGSLKQWLKRIEPTFGIVKHDKPTRFFQGELVQTHYQLLNTLQLSKKDMEEFLAPALDFIRLLKTETAVVQYYIKYPTNRPLEQASMLTANDIVFNLMNINGAFTRTKTYQDFLNTLIAAYYKKLKSGNVLINGNYSTILGNPVEMLQQAIGRFRGETQLGIGNIHTKRFPFGQTVLCCRSPHVTMGNVLLAKNTANINIDAYFNLTKEIICINSIGENILQRLSGADFDSDTVMITDNSILIRAAKRNYKAFQVPTNLVESKKTVRTYTPEQQADLDKKTSTNKIGEIINLSQMLNSLYWDNIASGQSHKENHKLYCDITKLDVLSGIEIDKAKREFEVDTIQELKSLREKYSEHFTDYTTEKKLEPFFFSHIARQKGYYDTKKKKYSKYDTSMDYLQTIVNSYRIRCVKKRKYIPFVEILDKRQSIPSQINHKKVDFIISVVSQYRQYIKRLWVSEKSTGEKMSLYMKAKEDCICSITFTKVNYSTMYYLLTLLEDKQYTYIKRSLLDILFRICNNSFYDVLKVNQQELIPYLNTSTGEAISIFDKTYYKNYKPAKKLTVGE